MVAQMLCWLAAGAHEAVQVVTLQSVSQSISQLLSFRTLLIPDENEGKPVEPPSPALL